MIYGYWNSYCNSCFSWPFGLSQNLIFHGVAMVSPAIHGCFVGIGHPTDVQVKNLEASINYSVIIQHRNPFGDCENSYCETAPSCKNRVIHRNSWFHQIFLGHKMLNTSEHRMIHSGGTSQSLIMTLCLIAVTESFYQSYAGWATSWLIFVALFFSFFHVWMFTFL